MKYFVGLAYLGSALYGWTAAGFLGTVTGLVTTMLISTGLLLATRPSPPGFVPGALIGVVSAVVVGLAAVWGGWKIGWLYAAVAYVVVVFLAGRINSLLARAQYRRRSQSEGR